MAWKSLVATNEDGTTEELDPRSMVITAPSGADPELFEMQMARQRLEFLTPQARVRVLNWLVAYFAAKNDL